MKLLFENWRRFLAEISVTPEEYKNVFQQAILQSQFWTSSNKLGDVDIVDKDRSELGTPASEALEVSLTKAASELGTEFHFEISTSSDEEYILGPDDPFGKYPNNWLTYAQYRFEDGRHIVFLELRPLAEDYNLSEFKPEVFAKIMAMTINHEIIHYQQLKKQAEKKGLSDADAWRELLCDPKQTEITDPVLYKKECGKEVPEGYFDVPARERYLRSHIEIDAFAYEAAEQLIDSYGEKEAINVIRKLKPVDIEKYPEISDIVKDYAKSISNNPKILNKFRKKVYQQIVRMGEHETSGRI